jgi:hypothetical protein
MACAAARIVEVCSRLVSLLNLVLRVLYIQSRDLLTIQLQNRGPEIQWYHIA